MTDPISDMLTRIRNASLTRAADLVLPMSKIKFAIAKILQEEGYLAGVETFNDGARPMLRLHLSYNAGVPAISSIVRKSKPSRRFYVKADELKVVRSGQGMAILSTPNGLMTNSEARKRRLGGELICEVY